MVSSVRWALNEGRWRVATYSSVRWSELINSRHAAKSTDPWFSVGGKPHSCTIREMPCRAPSELGPVAGSKKQLTRW